MKKTIILLFIFILILGCSKKSDDEIIDTPDALEFNLISENTTVKQLQFVLLSSTQINFNEEIYSAKFGNIDVTLVKTKNNRLIFSVPEEIIGNTLLELTIDGKKGSLNFKVEENKIQNADQILDTELVTPLNDFNDTITELLNDTSFSLEIKDQLASAKQMIADYFAKFNTLSSEERTSVAMFFNANPILTTDYLNLSSKNPDGNQKYSMINRSAFILVFKIAIVITAAEIIAPLVISGLAGLGVFLGVSTVAAGIIVVAITAAAIIHAEHNRILNNALLPFKNLLKDDNDTYLNRKVSNKNNVNSEYQINNNVNYVFNLISVDRLLNKSDINNQNTEIEELVTKINLLSTIWGTFKNGVNSIISSTASFFNSWFSSTPTTYKLISYNFEELPETTELNETTGQSEFISIDDFPIDIDLTYTITSNNSINLKFNADENTLPRTITGKIKYNDGSFLNENEFTVVLKGVNLSLEYVSGNNQSGVENKQLEQPIIVKVIDDNGNPVSNTNVNFKTENGEGSVTTSRITTNSDGLAQTNWILGDFIGEQSLEADIVKDDGTFLNTPITFNSTCNIDLSGVWAAKYTSGDCSEGEIETGTTRSFEFNLDNSRTITVSGGFNDYVTSSSFNQNNLSLSVIINSSQNYQYGCSGEEVSSNEIGRITYSGTYNTATKVFEGTYTHSFTESGNSCTENTICSGNVRISRQ